MSSYFKDVAITIFYIAAVTVVLEVIAAMRGVPSNIGAVALVIAGISLIRVYERR